MGREWKVKERKRRVKEKGAEKGEDENKEQE